MSSLTSLKEAIETTEVFLDESNRTKIKRFISDKMTLAKADKNAVEIALTFAKGLPMKSFMIPEKLEAGKKAEEMRKNNLILLAFQKKNAEHIAVIEEMSDSSAAERVELNNKKFKLATMKTAYVDSLNDWFDYLGVLLQKYVTPSLAATLNAETGNLWDKVSDELDESRPDGCQMG